VSEEWKLEAYLLAAAELGSVYATNLYMEALARSVDPNRFNDPTRFHWLRLGSSGFHIRLTFLSEMKEQMMAFSSGEEMQVSFSQLGEL
jgi:hypothetical protein